MLIKKSNMLDISHLKPKAVSCYLVGALAGRDSNKTNIERKTLSTLSRLIDKAIAEYDYAKTNIEAEERENKMSYKEILKRKQGQLIYTCPIINNLENCITTLARIYKIKERHLGHRRNQDIINIRDSVEHVDERIRDSSNEPPVLNISKNSLVIEIAKRGQGKISIRTKDIAKEIINLYKEIRRLLK